MKQRFSADELIVNYHDACVYGRDLAILESSSAWLNGECIHFYMTWLQQQQQRSADDANTLFLDPSVISFLMHQCQDEDDLQEFANGSCQGFFAGGGDGGSSQSLLRLVVPVNDHLAASQDTWAVVGAGSHWSLLILCYQSSSSKGNTTSATYTAAFHLDSAGGNLTAATMVATKIEAARASLPGNKSSSSSDLNVVQCTVPKQQNGYDCGIHALAAAQAIAAMSPADTTRTSIETAVASEIDLKASPGYCASFRRTIAALVRQEASP